MKTPLLAETLVSSVVMFLTKLNRPGWRWLVAFLLLILLSWQSARLLWLWIAPSQMEMAQMPPKAEQGAQSNPLWSNLFPPNAHKAIANAQDEAYADASVLKGWQLLGVVLDASMKLALVQQGSGGGLLWLQENQLTPQGVKVERIEATQVQLLTRQGRQWLKLASSHQSDMSANQSTRSATPTVANLSALRQQAKQNPTVAMQWLNVQPQFDKGRLVSVLVQPKAGQEAIFKQLGFVEGDQLLALNGQPMSEWMSRLASLPSLLDGTGASIKVLRAGKEQEWSLTW